MFNLKVLSITKRIPNIPFSLILPNITKSILKPEFKELVEESISHLLPWIYLSGYFDNISKELFKDTFKDISQVLKDKLNKKGLVGVMIAISNSLINTQLLKTSLLQIINKENSPDFKAIISIMNNDNTNEMELKNFMKKIGVHPKLGYNLLSVCNPNGNNKIFSHAYNICKNYCKNPSAVAALVGLFKGDITNLEFITKSLNLDIKNTYLLLSTAKKDKDIDYTLLADKLGIEDKKAMEKIIRIAKGDLSVIQHLKYRGKSLLNFQEFELLEALLVFVKHRKNNHRGKFLKEMSIIGSFITWILK